MLTNIMKVERVIEAPDRRLQLHAEAVEFLNEQGWPVGHFERVESAGDSLEGQDTYLWVTPGGIAMRAYVGRVEVPPQSSTGSSTLKTVLLSVEEGW